MFKFLLSLIILTYGSISQAQIVSKLNEVIPELTFQETSFEQVTDFIADYTKSNIVVRWQVLGDVGINKDTSISIKAKNLRLSQVLWLIMNELSIDTKLAYLVEGNTLIFSTDEDLCKDMYVKVYDIADLLVRIPNSSRPDFTQNSQGLGNQGGSGGSLFGNSQGQNQQYEQNTGQPNSDLQRLVEIIQDTIEPDSWRMNGGLGTISEFRGLLVIRNSIKVHQLIGGLQRGAKNGK